MTWPRPDGLPRSAVAGGGKRRFAGARRSPPSHSLRCGSAWRSCARQRQLGARSIRAGPRAPAPSRPRPQAPIEPQRSRRPGHRPTEPGRRGALRRPQRPAAPNRRVPTIREDRPRGRGHMPAPAGMPVRERVHPSIHRPRRPSLPPPGTGSVSPVHVGMTAPRVRPVRPPARPGEPAPTRTPAQKARPVRPTLPRAMQIPAVRPGQPPLTQRMAVRAARPVCPPLRPGRPVRQLPPPLPQRIRAVWRLRPSLAPRRAHLSAAVGCPRLARGPRRPMPAPDVRAHLRQRRAPRRILPTCRSTSA